MALEKWEKWNPDLQKNRKIYYVFETYMNKEWKKQTLLFDFKNKNPRLLVQAIYLL